MSKGNMLLGHARGKVGSLVFSRTQGKQIVRARAEVIKNPKTLLQVIQRTFMNTVSQAYSTTKAITDHSFQGVADGQPSMSKFMQLNLEYLRKRVAEWVNNGGSLEEFYNFAPIGQSGIFPGPWIVSDGKLPRVPVTISAYTDFGSAKMQIEAPENTYASIIEKYGLQRGDQLTFVTVEAPLSSVDLYFNIARVILDPREEDGSAAPLSTAFVTDGAIQKPNTKNQGNFDSIAYANGMFTLRMTNGDVISAGIIVSRKNNDVWERSKCQMVFSEDACAASGTGNYIDMYSAIEQSHSVTIDVLNQLYLNNAGVGGKQNTNSGQSQGGGTSSPTYSNTISIVSAGNTQSQNIAGGSTSVLEHLTKVEVNGANLTAGVLKAGTTNAAADATALTINDTATKATWTGDVAANGSLYVFKGDTLWFVISVQAPSGDGGTYES